MRKTVCRIGLHWFNALFRQEWQVSGICWANVFPTTFNQYGIVVFVQFGQRWPNNLHPTFHRGPTIGRCIDFVVNISLGFVHFTMLGLRCIFHDIRFHKLYSWPNVGPTVLANMPTYQLIAYIGPMTRCYLGHRQTSVICIRTTFAKLMF